MLFSELQKAFDRDWAEERISYDGWQKNASNDGVMAYKLLAQTGEKETINRSIVCFEKLIVLKCRIVYSYFMVYTDLLLRPF